jgi:hypothetical protein
MDVTSLAQIILGFVAIVAVGWLLKRLGILHAEDTRPINAVIIYVGLPAMIFRAIHGAELRAEFAIVALVAWAVFGVTALVAWGLSRALALPRATAGGFILAAALGNTGYVGYPVSQAFLGDAGLVRAIFFDVLGTVMALLFVGLVIAERMGQPETKRLNLVREILGFPAVLAFFMGLLTRGVAVPVVVGDWLDALANLVVPLIMISVGLSLRAGTIRERALALVALSGVRLVLAPLVALGLGALVLADVEALRLVVIEAGVPSMMLTLVIGARFKLDTDFIASAILVTTIASVATIPLMQLLVA